ncbi:hypothetical protein KO465_04855 [Candidatus Micrarchaeota archaeon]|nr:hypothetical protein [Candidatus Micrarchaeota archaeon]
MIDDTTYTWSNRCEEFIDFCTIVIEHIEEYTVKQYGDAPDDPVQEWSAKKCIDCIERYVNRFETNRRGRLETLRDMAKISHFACMAFYKLKPTAEEILKIKTGTI